MNDLLETLLDLFIQWRCDKTFGTIALNGTRMTDTAGFAGLFLIAHAHQSLQIRPPRGIQGNRMIRPGSQGFPDLPFHAGHHCVCPLAASVVQNALICVDTPPGITGVAKGSIIGCGRQVIGLWV